MAGPSSDVASAILPQKAGASGRNASAPGGAEALDPADEVAFGLGHGEIGGIGLARPAGVSQRMPLQPMRAARCFAYSFESSPARARRACRGPALQAIRSAQASFIGSIFPCSASAENGPAAGAGNGSMMFSISSAARPCPLGGSSETRQPRYVVEIGSTHSGSNSAGSAASIRPPSLRPAATMA